MISGVAYPLIRTYQVIHNVNIDLVSAMDVFYNINIYYNNGLL